MSKEKTVFVSGHFNVLHIGHFRLLRYAKSLGTKLIVGVESDQVAGEAAHLKEELRFNAIKNIDWIDKVILIEKSLEHALNEIKPSIVVKGREHENLYNSEKDIIEKFSGKLIFSSGEFHLSSSSLIKKELSIKNKTVNKAKNFLNRHNISKPRLLDLINNFSKLRVLVIGDLIIDEYITCQPIGMSQEDPTIVVSPIDSVKFVGGAGIVAAHAAGLGAKSNFISITGDDELYDFSKSFFEKYKVNSILIKDYSRPTTLKTRFRAKNKTLLRVNKLHQQTISKKVQDRIMSEIENLIDDIDLFIFSDFNYGCLPTTLVERINSLLKNKNILVFADSQSSSQAGDISRFKNMNLITPTEYEARISLKDFTSGLVVLSNKLIKDTNCKNIFLKLGGEGVLIEKKKKNKEYYTDRIDALNTNPKDTAGAGDSMLISSALTLSLGSSIWEAAYIGSIAAAVQVSRIGNIPLTTSEIKKLL